MIRDLENKRPMRKVLFSLEKRGLVGKEGRQGKEEGGNDISLHICVKEDYDELFSLSTEVRTSNQCNLQ